MTFIRYVDIFRKDTSSCEPPTARPGIEFAKVSESDISTQGNLPGDVFERQRERLRRFGTSHCYGVYVSGDLASFAWLLPHDAMAMDTPCVLTGRPGEAELTAAETLPAYRGQRLHVFLSRRLFLQARENGIHTVFLKRYRRSRITRRKLVGNGIEHIGTSVLFSIPGLASTLAWPRRFVTKDT